MRKSVSVHPYPSLLLDLVWSVVVGMHFCVGMWADGLHGYMLLMFHLRGGALVAAQVGHWYP